MIIIKIIFLYFIEIAHADDFPSAGTRLVKDDNLTSVVAVRVIAVSTCRWRSTITYVLLSAWVKHYYLIIHHTHFSNHYSLLQMNGLRNIF